MVQGAKTTVLTYNDANQCLTETNTAGTLAGLGVVRVFDTSMRLQTLDARNASGSLQSATYAYDTAGRLATVTDSAYVATYSYAANSMLVSGLALTNGAGSGLATTKVWDKLNRLTSISSKPYGASAPSLPVSFAYQYNSANQRTRATLGDGSFWVYQYDKLGQVVSGKRYWSDGTPVAGQQFEYGFDDIGNRTSTKAGGDQTGWNLRSATYTANSALGRFRAATRSGSAQTSGPIQIAVTLAAP